MATIDLAGVTVRFPVYGSGLRFGALRSGIGAAVGGAIRRDSRGPVFVEALRDVSLSLARGARVGLIGHNGSGKSTLLHLVAGIYEPCAGRIAVRGRVFSLFDPMLGMSLDCNGRDNVVLRGIYLGLKPREAKARIAEIAEFCELGAYMDLPLKAWSTGMQLRLAFAIATAFDPEILLLDEQFLMGDAAFREKAEKRLERFVDRAGIVIQASHSEELIRKTCSTAILLDHGRLAAMGETGEVFDRYRENLGREATNVG